MTLALRPAVVGRLLLVGLMVVTVVTGCASTPDSTSRELPAAPQAPADPLTDALGATAATDPPSETTAPEFCAGVATLTAAGSLSIDEIIARYRDLLQSAPAEIAPEIAALIDYLATGATPQFADSPGELGPESTPVADPDPAPTDEPSEDPSGEWRDEVLFGTADGEQLAVTMAEFLESHCRGTAVSPLPAPIGLENEAGN